MIHGNSSKRHPCIWQVKCPTCGAKVGKSCHVTVADGPHVGKAIPVHKTRIKKASGQ